MAGTVNDVMTGDPRCVAKDATLQDAAQQMRDADIGAILIVDGDSVAGIVTDRDIAIRGVAEGKDPGSTPVSDVGTSDVVTLSPDQSVEEALSLMQQHDVRRLPVVADGKPAGIVSLGDLSDQSGAGQALADISDAPANN